MDSASARSAAARALVIAVVLVSLFSFFFVYPGHDPQPHGLPIALVADDAVAERASDLLDTGESFDVRRAASRSEAVQQIEQREVYGALVFRRDGPAEVLVASAASAPVAEFLGNMADELGVQVSDVRETDAEDPRGVTINLMTLAVTVPSILGAMLMFTMAPTLTPVVRVLMLAAFGVLGGVAATLIVQVGMGALPGSFVAIAAVTALAIFAVAAASAGLMQLAGPPGIGLCFILFLMLGNPASGASAGRHLLPEPWQTGGQFLPPGAFSSGIRNTAYFDAAQAEVWLTVLVAYAVAGTLVLLLMRGATPAAPARPAAAPRAGIDVAL